MIPFVAFIGAYAFISIKLAPESKTSFTQRLIAVAGGMAAFAISAAIL